MTEFLWLGDRFQHRVLIQQPGGELRSVLQSVEGTSAEAWPASPPLQSLHTEALPDGRRAALLVGMAGGSHWSASIEASLHAAELVFDIACRHSNQPGSLLSSYRLAHPGLPAVQGDHDCAWQVADRRLLLGIETAVGPSQLTVASETVRIEAATAARRTTRWKYRLRLLPADGQLGA